MTLGKWERERRTYTQLVASNFKRCVAATDDELLEVVQWLNENEPTMLREALDEAGVA